MTALTLYTTPLSGHGHRVKLLLTLMNLPFEEREAGAEQRKTAEFLAVNPLGQVPVLIDDGTAIVDSNAILIWLVKRYAPDSQWLPKDLKQEVEVHQWLAKAAGEIRYGVASARLIKQFSTPENYDSAKSVAAKFLPQMAQHLSDRRWLVGEQATLADVACYAYVACAPEGGITLTPFPDIQRWIQQVEALPGFVGLPSLPIPEAG
ncbi:glutathione S-transferase family protein [Erwinia billingiae]|uniref:glutathione S-transferase family protein n=1 Tax=Erwinia billingiae TaxID=182337 RepID=UPI000D005485|nr:glutathione S-transferase [Erwinia billingiae]PRB62475.1 glutathione S-transferase [Erwinia billingiae]